MQFIQNLGCKFAGTAETRYIACADSQFTLRNLDARIAKDLSNTSDLT